MTARPPILLLLALAACQPNEDLVYPDVQTASPRAGAAEGRLELPIGVPLGCFSSRSSLLGTSGSVDRRQGAYTTGFTESAGIHTRPAIKVLWIENGDDHLVYVKTDMCMANDGVVAVLTERLSAATGADLDEKVVMSVSHSHAAYGCYSDQWHWYLGVDRNNEEIFERTIEQISDVALQAWETRQDAAIGVGWAVDWDPNDRVYRDRRENNNATTQQEEDNGVEPREELIVWDDQSDWETTKDPHLNLLRVDSVDGDPIAFAFTFGIHGTVLGGDNNLVSQDATGGLESVIAQHVPPGVVAMHMQGAGGDASPAGSDGGPARIESIGEYAKDPILDLWEATPTSADPIRMETASRHIWQHHSQIEVTRDGAVDWRYSELVPPEEHVPDEVIYDDSGGIVSPIDEFNAPYGAVFCGSDSPLIPGFGVGTQTFPYSACVDVSAIGRVVAVTFDHTLDDVVLPFPETMKAGTLATRIGPFPTLLPDGSSEQRHLTAGFFPGEVTAMYAEQWRRRTRDELDWDYLTVTYGYSQDHEGYLLIPEDWLRGGYEPNINMWGPLQAEHIMEGVLDYAAILNTDVREEHDPLDFYAPTPRGEHELPGLTPDLTPDAGTRLTALPVFDDTVDFYVPRGIAPEPEPPSQIERLDLVQLVWEGGDPAVDPPHVYIERMDGGAWTRLTAMNGEPVSEAFTDILVSYTPWPLFPIEAQQNHYYWAGWQAVGHVHERAALPTGTYRMVVEGKRWAGGDTTWPWTTEDYLLEGPEFEILPATIQLEAGDGGLWAWMDAPADGWRLVDVEGNSQGRNPVRGAVTVDIDGSVQTLDADAPTGGRAWIPVNIEGASAVTVTDGAGNVGTL